VNAANDKPTNPAGKTIALVSAGWAATQSPPLHLLCLSTVLEGQGYATEIYDFQVAPHRQTRFLEDVRRNRFLWVGFTTLTPNANLTKKHIIRVRETDPTVPIFLGGIHASSLPEMTLREFPIDALCVGDGEDAVLRLSETVRAARRDYWEIPGVAALDEAGRYRFSRDAAETRPRRPLPRPHWEKIDLREYQQAPLQYIRRRRMVAPIIIAKGCPNRCSFCAVPEFSGRRLLQREPGEVVAEIDYLARRRGVQEIQLLDDNFNANLNYAKRVLREWAARRLPVIWKAPVGLWIHHYDDEWFDLLEQTGCYQVGFGIESGAQEILDRAEKRLKLAEVPDILKKYRRRGISTFGFFILGLPGETEQTIRQTARFACRLPLDHAHLAQFTPYPGSPLFRQALADGLVLPDWDEYHHYHRTDRFAFCEVPTRRIRRAMRFFYLRFYAKPRRALHLLNDIRHSGLRSFWRLARQIYLKGGHDRSER